MKTILVPTDFSEVSENAAEYAAELAKLTKAKLIFFSVFMVPVPMVDVPIVIIPTEDIEKGNMKLLHELEIKIKAKYGNIETQVHTRPGFVVEEIINFAQNHKIDLIIMGVTGAGKTQSMLGSNAISVMHRTASPVIVVPKRYKFKKPSIIALACDYKSIIPDETINKFKLFVRLFSSKALIFNILKTHELATYQKAVTEVNLENSLSDIEHSLYFPSNDNLPQEINTFINKHRVDMLTMFPRHYSLFKGLVHHSATKEMAFLSHVPLLSIHE